MRPTVLTIALAALLFTGFASAATPTGTSSVAAPASATSATPPATASSAAAPASAAVPASATSVATPAAASTAVPPAPATGIAAPATPDSTALPSAATPSPSATKVSPADRKRMAAIEQYQHDLVTVVALRADPDYLLGAAILAIPFKDATPGLDFDSLSERAAAGGQPASQWLRLSACASDQACPDAKAYQRLKQHAADNAAVWLVALDVAARDKDAKAERAALKQAASAKSYDDYYGKALAAVAKAVAVLPPLPDTMQGAHDGQPDNADGVRTLVSLFATQAHLRPAFDPLDQLCNKQDAARHADIKADCLKLAHTLQWGSSPLARAMGLRIQGELDPQAAAQTDPASRNLGWQVQQYSTLLRAALTDPASAGQWLDAARTGGTELSLILATLRAHHIPSEAPADGSTTP